MTPFSAVYEAFLSKVTADMYMELDEEQTKALLKEILFSSLHWFEFPRVNLYAYEGDNFEAELSYEEINILAIYMIVEWIGQQLATVEVIRMKYSSNDFKFTSQANHMHKLKDLKKDYERVGLHAQRLYKRRKADPTTGIMKSTFGSIMGGQ